MTGTGLFALDHFSVYILDHSFCCLQLSSTNRKDGILKKGDSFFYVKRGNKGLICLLFHQDQMYRDSDMQETRMVEALVAASVQCCFHYTHYSYFSIIKLVVFIFFFKIFVCRYHLLIH